MPLDAADVMTKDVIAAAPDDTVARIACRLAKHHISAVPVLDAAGTLLGMLSEADLLRPFEAETENRRVWWLRMLAEGSDLSPQFLAYVRADQRHARDLMSTSVISVTETTPAREVAALLIRHRIKSMPVLCDGKLVGIVARADLVRAISRQSGELDEPL
jgi:CBS domain-containing protein